MSRDSGGTYVLPAGNPVTPDTIIESAWANTTMPDLGNEITNSLDRQGRGGMLAPLKIFDGNVSAPGLGFTQDPNNGLARIGTDEWVLVSGGVAVMKLQPTLVSSLVQMSYSTGFTVAAGNITLTNGSFVSNGGGTALIAKRSNNTTQSNYIVGRNSADENIWTFGNLAGNNNVHLQALAASSMTVATDACSMTASGTGFGSFLFNADIVLQKRDTPAVGAIVFGNAGANLYYDGTFSFNASLGISVAGFISATGQVNAVGFAPGTQTPAGTGSISISWAAGSNALIALTGALSITSITNIPIGAIQRISFSSTAAGAVTWPANVVWPTPGTAPDLAAGSAKKAMVTLYNDGASLLANASAY